MIDTRNTSSVDVVNLHQQSPAFELNQNLSTARLFSDFFSLAPRVCNNDVNVTSDDASS